MAGKGAAGPATATQEQELLDRYFKPALFKHRSILLYRSARTLQTSSANAGEVRNKKVKDPNDASTIPLMLLGMAIECIQKALVGQAEKKAGCASNEVTARIKQRFKKLSHRLDDGAAAANIALTRQQQEVLGALTECVVWAGRYGAPLYADQVPIADGLISNLTIEDLWSVGVAHFKFAKAEYQRRK